MDWADYLRGARSEEWFSIREAVLDRDGGKCRITGDTRELQIHHLTYRNVGSEQLSDLVTLCKDAHLVVHDTKHAMHARYTAKLRSITEAA